MVNLDELIQQWINVRQGVRGELDLVPEDKLGFRATPETRSILEMAQHIVQTEKLVVGLTTQQEPVTLQSWKEGRPKVIAAVEGITSKQALLELLENSIRQNMETVTGLTEERLAEKIMRFDGRKVSRFAMLYFTMAHEMYHRGQMAMSLRLLGKEPALTALFKKMMKQD